LKKFWDSKSVEVKQDDDTPSYIQWLKLKLQRRSKSKDRVFHEDNANISDTVYLVNETQKLVSVFNANFHDQIQVYMSIEPELTIIFSNALFVKSAISNFLYNSFSNVKRKIRFNRNDTQEIIIFIRIINSTQCKSFTSKKLIRVDFIDTGTVEKNKPKIFPSNIWNQVSQLFGISDMCSSRSINNDLYKNISTLYLPFRFHPLMVSVKKEYLRSSIFRISKSRNEILKLRASYNMNDHMLKERMINYSKIDGKKSVLIVCLDEVEEVTLNRTRTEFYTTLFNVVDITELQTLDYGRLTSYDCILLNIPDHHGGLSKQYGPQLNIFFKTLKVVRYYNVIAALVNANDDLESIKHCNYIIQKPLLKMHTTKIADKIRYRCIEHILSI